MTDKTAPELVADYVRTLNEIEEHGDKKYLQSLTLTKYQIIYEMKEWYEEKINKDNFIRK